MTRRLAVVTGASSGIGLSLAKELANRNYDLIVASAGERLGPAAEELRGTGVEVVDVRADLATRGGVDELWRRIESSGRTLDIACINAGIGVGGSVYRDRPGHRAEDGGRTKGELTTREQPRAPSGRKISAF